MVDNLTGHLDTLYDAMTAEVTSVTNADDITGSVDAEFLAAGLVSGMSIVFKAVATNTGAMTVALNGGSAVSLLGVAGAALTAGQVVAGQVVKAVYLGGDWVVTSPLTETTPILTTAIETLAHTVLATDQTYVVLAGFADSALYRGYKIVGRNFVPRVNNADIQIQTSSDGGTSYDSAAADYAWVTERKTAGFTSDEGGSASDSAIEMTRDIASSGAGVDFEITLEAPELVRRTMLRFQGVAENTSGLAAFRGGGYRNIAGVVDALRLFFDSGDVASGAEVTVYGVRAA